MREIPHTGPHNLIIGLINRFEDYRVRLTKATKKGRGIPFGNVRIRPPVSKPGKIDCMAANYMEMARELNQKRLMPVINHQNQ